MEKKQVISEVLSLGAATVFTVDVVFGGFSWISFAIVGMVCLGLGVVGVVTSEVGVQVLSSILVGVTLLSVSMKKLGMMEGFGRGMVYVLAGMTILVGLYQIGQGMWGFRVQGG